MKSTKKDKKEKNSKITQAHKIRQNSKVNSFKGFRYVEFESNFKTA